MPDDFDIENYTKEVFFMFSGEKVLVDLRCDNSLMKTMVDRFGEDVTTLAYAKGGKTECPCGKVCES